MATIQSTPILVYKTKGCKQNKNRLPVSNDFEFMDSFKGFSQKFPREKIDSGAW